MAPNWYVLRSKPRKESALCQYARSEGHQVYLPEIPANPVNPRARKEVPFFPGYLFVHTCVDDVGQSEFRWMPFSQGLVRVGDEPAALNEGFIRALRARVHAIQAAGGLTKCTFEHGDAVVVEAGPFAGYGGIFDLRLNGQARARILLKMLHDRYIPAEVPFDHLRREGPRRTH